MRRCPLLVEETGKWLSPSSRLVHKKCPTGELRRIKIDRTITPRTVPAVVGCNRGTPGRH